MTNYSKIRQKKAGTWINKQDRIIAQIDTKKYHQFKCDDCKQDFAWRKDRCFLLNLDSELCCDGCHAKI